MISRQTPGVTMDDIGTDLGIGTAQALVENVVKLSDQLINNPRDVLERAAQQTRRPPSKRALKARFGLGLLTTEDDPPEREDVKDCFLNTKGRTCCR